MFKQLGLVSIIAMWLGTYILIKYHKLNLEMTISKHAAKSARYHVVYGILELVVVGLFSLFIFCWFMPTFKLGHWYTLSAIIGVAGTVIAAFIPDRAGWENKVHSVAAYGMAVALLLMSFFLLVSSNIDMITRLLLYISVASMTAGLLIAVIHPNFYRRNMFKCQVLYFAAFQVPIILAVYL